METFAGKAFDKETLERVAFMSFIIPEFGEAYKMEKRKAYLYLKEYGGIDYIYRHWWALHTDNPRHALRDIFDICKKNGGYLSKSLGEIERISLLALCDIEDIGHFIIIALMNDYNLTELNAEDLYFTSNIYAKLCDESTRLYEKTPHELYEMLKRERLKP